MRRLLLLAGVLFAGFLVAVPALAAGAGREVERELAFDIDVEGFSAWVLVSNNDGDVDATIFLRRGTQVAYYSAPAEVTADRVTAQFGTLGALDYRFAPKPNGNVRCTGSENGEAVFDGTFAFTGERGYVSFEAGHAEGSFQVYPEPKGCSPKGNPRSLRRVVPYSPSYSDKGVTLQAETRWSGKEGRQISVYDLGQKGPHRVLVYAILGELREGMTVVRGVQLTAKSTAFRWSLDQGTATLRPPAPFTGWASFKRYGRKGRGTWKGSLTMPILGGDPVKLTGGEFRSFMHEGVPQDR